VVAGGMVTTSLKQLGKRIQLLLHGIRFISEHLLLKHGATTSAGKPVSILILGSIANKMPLSSFFVGCSVLV